MAVMETINKNFLPLYNVLMNSLGHKIKIAVMDDIGCTGNFEFCDLGSDLLNERMVKMLLWAKGGYKIITNNKALATYCAMQYSSNGARKFDYGFFGDVYCHKMEVVHSSEVPNISVKTLSGASSLDGCRIGLDVGASELKVCSIIDGVVKYDAREPWLPKAATSAQYHYECILKVLKSAAAFLPRVDSIGISSAGVILNNQIKVSSLFMGVDKNSFDSARNLFVNVGKNFAGARIACANDGDVAALAGAREAGAKDMLGLSLGTSTAGGVLSGGVLNGWLNELAFVPIDVGSSQAQDEWSGDIGCGVNYLSQDGVTRLAEMGGFKFAPTLSAGEKMRYFAANAATDLKERVFNDMGIYLGNSLLLWQKLYGFDSALVLGGVMAAGGDIISDSAKAVIASCDAKIKLLKVNKNNLGQCEAAASLA